MNPLNWIGVWLISSCVVGLIGGAAKARNGGSVFEVLLAFVAAWALFMFASGVVALLVLGIYLAGLEGVK